MYVGLLIQVSFIDKHMIIINVSSLELQKLEFPNYLSISDRLYLQSSNKVVVTLKSVIGIQKFTNVRFGEKLACLRFYKNLDYNGFKIDPWGDGDVKFSTNY